jgi:hypothetical protein
MTRFEHHRVLSATSDQIVQLLTDRQHTHPHMSVRSVMEQATTELGCCPQAIARATDWLAMDVEQPVGRLRRSELLQLARAVYRFWRETTPEAVPPPGEPREARED